MSERRAITWRDLTLEFAIGLFFFGALVLLGLFTIILARENLFAEGRELRVIFPEVAALTEGDNVLALGVDIGRVREVNLTDAGVSVVLGLDKNLNLYRDYLVEVRYSSILGGRYVYINPGTESAGRLAADAEIEGQTPTELFTEAASLIRSLGNDLSRIRQRLEEEKLLDKLVSTIDNVYAAAEDLRNGRGTLGRLLQDDSAYEHALSLINGLEQAGRKVETAAGNIDAAVSDLRSGKGTLGLLMTDERLYHDVQAIAADLRAGRGTLGRLLSDDSLYLTMEEAGQDLARLSRSLSSEDSSLGRLFSDDGEVYESLALTLKRTQDIVLRIDRGEGSLGLLIKDPALYDEAKQTLLDIRAAVQDFREQAPVSTFGSLIFSAF